MRNSGDPPPELVVVDDASSDGSSAFLLGGEYSRREIRVLRNESARGVIQSRALGVDLARGRYLCILDAHCTVEHGWLAQMIGMLAGIEQGWARADIAQAAYEYQCQVETGARPVVGVNCFEEKSMVPISLHRPRPQVVQEQITRLQTLRRERDNHQVERTLKVLRQEAQGTGNLMFPILEAVRAYATIGEICTVLREVFGEHAPQGE